MNAIAMDIMVARNARFIYQRDIVPIFMSITTILPMGPTCMEYSSSWTTYQLLWSVQWLLLATFIAPS